MQEFACQQNIKHFEQLLKSESDPKVRAVLSDLLEAERTKLAALQIAEDSFGRLYTAPHRVEVERGQGG